jgi:sodium/proline symporter
MTEDFFKPLFGPSLKDEHSLMIIRGCIIGLPLLSYLISFNSTSAVNDLVSYAWSGLGLSFAPAVIAGLYFHKAHKVGVQVAMFVGGVLGMIWPYFRLGFMPLLPGFILCMALLMGISLLKEK